MNRGFIFNATRASWACTIKIMVEPMFVQVRKTGSNFGKKFNPKFVTYTEKGMSRRSNKLVEILFKTLN